jgi:predicted transcriptional regulator
MEYVWELQEATVAQIVQKISQRREVTYTTVLAAMQRLEKKGWITHRSEGRAHVYRPVRSRQAVRRGALRELLESVFQGDPRLLLANFLDEQPRSDAELVELRDLIEQRRKERRDG